MKAIVAGGAGFLGSHLCEKLVNGGNEVLCVDNLITGSIKNIGDLNLKPNFKFLNFDITSSFLSNMSKLFLSEMKADQIYHLASPASPNPESKKSYHSLPFETMLANSTGTWNLANFAHSINAKFLFTSTSEMYGEPLEHPQKESYRGNVSTVGPRSVYDESKRFGETITYAFIRSKGLDARIVRIFNTYGSKMAQDDGRVVVEFIKSALLNKPLTVFGDGKATRSFCFESDLIEGLILAMNKENTKGQIFNLGNPTELSIMELAKKILSLTESHSQIVFDKAQEDDPTRRCPDISKAKQILGWEPKISLEEGLKKLIEYVKDNLDTPFR